MRNEQQERLEDVLAELVEDSGVNRLFYEEGYGKYSYELNNKANIERTIREIQKVFDEE